NGSGETTLLRARCGVIRIYRRGGNAGRDGGKGPERARARGADGAPGAPPLAAPGGGVGGPLGTPGGVGRGGGAGPAPARGLDVACVSSTRARDLSGGTKQKLLAALALAARPEVLVCDEPTANLDARAREAFFDAVARRPKDAVLVVCSHRVDEVRRFVDRVV